MMLKLMAESERENVKSAKIKIQEKLNVKMQEIQKSIEIQLNIKNEEIEKL